MRSAKGRPFNQGGGKVAHGASLLGAALGDLLVDVQRNDDGDPLGSPSDQQGSDEVRPCH